MSILCFIWDDTGRVALRRESPSFIRSFPAGFERDLRLRPPNCAVANLTSTPFTICRHAAACAEGARFSGSSTAHSVALVKSSLQKAVRRGLQRAALYATAHLIAREPKELLRRLPVILVEDVGVCEDLPKLMWLSVAVQSGYELSKDDLHFVLALVAAATVYPCRSSVECVGGAGRTSKADVVLNTLFVQSIPGNTRITNLESSGPGDRREDEHKNAPTVNNNNLISSCLALRACYGGMTGDIEMLLAFASNPASWIDHVMPSVSTSTPAAQDGAEMHSHEWILKLLSLTEHWSGPIPAEDQLDVAVDFHCSDIVPKFYKYLRSRSGAENCHLPASEQEVKNAIWVHRSSRNFRSPVLVPAALPCWWDSSAELELSRLSRAVWGEQTRTCTLTACQEEQGSTSAKRQRISARDTPRSSKGRQLSILRFAATAGNSAGA